MGFWIFVAICVGVIVHDVWHDPSFQEKLKNVEE
jgi:hypothetical protein